MCRNRHRPGSGELCARDLCIIEPMKATVRKTWQRKPPHEHDPPTENITEYKPRRPEDRMSLFPDGQAGTLLHKAEPKIRMCLVGDDPYEDLYSLRHALPS